jgi:hypothetical protein
MDSLDSYLEKFIEDNDILGTAYNNSYRIISGEEVDRILIDDFKKGLVSPFAFDPWEKPSKEILSKMRDYFESTSEFEKCAVLHKLIKD